MKTIRTGQRIEFPVFSGIRCLMMPYIQGDPQSVPEAYAPYKDIIQSVFMKKGDIGYLTIDESPVRKGQPHRGARARYVRALHTEAGWRPIRGVYQWAWGSAGPVTLERDVEILLANNVDNSCAVWDAEHPETSSDGDIGHVVDLYPFEDAIFMQAGEVCRIGILTPHESLPLQRDCNRQFLRIISSGVHGREEYFTQNPLFSVN